MALHKGGVHVEGRRPFPRPALEAGDQRVVRAPEPHQRGRLLRDRGLGPGGPEGAVLHVERLQEVAHGGRRGEWMSEERGQRLILAEHGEVLAAVPAGRPQRDETLDELRGRQAALPLLDRDLGIDCVGDPELAEQLDHERHAGAARDQRGVNRVIDLERQPGRVLRHRVPPCECCTHWVKPSKPDAIPADRMQGGSRRDSGCRSLS